MSYVLITEQLLSDIATSVRSKLGTSDQYKPSTMASTIDSITGFTADDEGKIIQNGALVSIPNFDSEEF